MEVNISSVLYHQSVHVVAVCLSTYSLRFKEPKQLKIHFPNYDILKRYRFMYS